MNPYAPLPDGAPLPEGRVPGVNCLPTEIPDFVGLEVGNPRRDIFQRFLNYDLQAAPPTPPGSHFLLFRGDSARAHRVQFKEEFRQGLHREGLADDDTGPLIDVTDIYTGLDTQSLGVLPEDIVWFTSALQSYGTAKRAAQDGRTLRILVDGHREPTGELTDAVNAELIYQTGTFLWQFELWDVTTSQRFDEIVVYNADDLSRPPVTIWTMGRPPLGERPDWIEGTWVNGDTASVASSDGESVSSGGDSFSVPSGDSESDIS